MKSMFKKMGIVSAFGLGIAMMGGDQAEAATDTSNLAVTATVLAFCEIVANPLAFPDYDPGTGAASTGSGSLAVDCTNNINFQLALGGGGNPGAVAGSTRAMAGQGAAAGSLLGYNLTFGGVAIPVAGNFTSATGNGYDGDGNAANDQIFTIDGSIPGSQSVAGGSYSDSVLATLTY